MYVSYFPQTISQWRSQGKSKHNRSNLPIKNLECDHVNISKNKNITYILVTLEFCDRHGCLVSRKKFFFSVNMQHACNWGVYHKLHKIMNKLKEYISYYKFWWVLLLSIFTSCAVFWQACRASRNTNKE